MREQLRKRKLGKSKGKRETPPDLISIWPAVDRVHQRAAELMDEHWKLPAEIKLVTGIHHQVMVEGFAHPLAATVALAEDLAHEIGFGVVPKDGDRMRAMSALERDCVRSHTSVDRSSPKTLEHAREALSLNDAQMQLIHDDADELKRRFA